MVNLLNKHPNSEIWFETQEKLGAYVFYIQEENGIKERILDMVKEGVLAIDKKVLEMNLNGEKMQVPCDSITSFLQIGLNPISEDARFTNVLNVFKYLLKLFNTTSHVLISPVFYSIYGCKSQDPDITYWPLDRSLIFHPLEDFAIVPGCFTRNNLINEGNLILDVEHVIMQDIESDIIKSLYYFKGKHLLYTNASLDVFFLNIFLDNWKKQKYQNFSSLIVHSAPGHGINEQLILKRFKLEKSDKKRVFTYPQIIQKHYKFPDFIKFNSSNGYDLRRDGDGRLATIKVTNEYFMFFVWD